MIIQTSTIELISTMLQLYDKMNMGKENQFGNNKTYTCHKCKDTGQIESLVIVDTIGRESLDRRLYICSCEFGVMKNDYLSDGGRRVPLFFNHHLIDENTFNAYKWDKTLREVENIYDKQSWTEEHYKMFNDKMVTFKKNYNDLIRKNKSVMPLKEIKSTVKDYVLVNDKVVY
jgi:hypothetical protein